MKVSTGDGGLLCNVDFDGGQPMSVHPLPGLLQTAEPCYIVASALSALRVQGSAGFFGRRSIRNAVISNAVSLTDFLMLLAQ
jgi:hypothetical protein